MKIKRLEVIGFKSFCDRSVVTFNEPITAVVGPNGCGKSNIVDAIRWCMGEQSAKHLRGGAMQDVIFAGSDSRGPLGMCEVTLVFENDGNVPIEYLAYSEIAVTRKLYRDGTSEYLLNKTPCRLRDVVDFFLGTGIGAKAYSIIEQGRVGMIVSSKPEDRRFLIEEAAGITKYKVKKKAAEKKMEQTRQNLLRVSDVTAEIEKQLASLRRQAQKAERYKNYKAELKDIELWSATQRWLGLHAEERVAAEAHAEIEAQREGAHTQLVAREAEVEAARLEAAHKEHALSAEQQALYELDNRIKLGEAEAEHEEREARQLDERADQGEEEIVHLDEQVAAELTDEEAAKSELGLLEESTAGQPELLRERDERWRASKEELANVQKQVDQTRHDVGACKGDIARAEGEERASTRRRDDLAIRVQRLQEEDARLQGRVAEMRHESGRLSDALGGLKQLTLGLTEERERSEARAAELKTSLQASGAELDALTADLHKKRSRRHSLEEIHAKYEGFARGTRAILAAKESRWGILGPIADFIDTPAELEHAVEAVLAERMGAVLVESQEVGVDAIELLKSKNEGRASFFPVNRFGDEKATPETPEGSKGRLLDRLHFAPEHEGLGRYLFGDVFLVDDLLTALDLWRADVAGGTRHTYVTLEGEVCDSHGVVTGGSREAAAAGVLQQKREMRELDEILQPMESRHADLLAQHTANKEELQAIQKSLEALRQDSHAHEMKILTHDKDLHRILEELSRSEQRQSILGEERAELERQAADAARETEEAALSVRAARDRLVSLEDQLSQLGHEQVRLLEAVDAAQEALTSTKIEMAQTEEKRNRLSHTISRLEAERADKGARKVRLLESIRFGREQAGELRGTAAARREELIRLVDERARSVEELQVARSAYEEQRAQLGQAEGEMKGMRQTLESLLGEATRLEVRRHDLAANRSHLSESIAERYRVDVRDHLHDYHLRAPVSDVEEARAEELRDLIDRMGEINLNAIEEYNELDKRFTFLSSQKSDLEKALAQLEEAIDRINKTSRQRFRQVFDLVNAKFQEIFPRCFRGGQARLVLTDEENLLESGIEIIAQPPGKKNSTVEVLSGGEKAMTAVALIFAIFLIKPSPFCLLDEVDAPLDEANVQRFNDLIRELTDRTQFIVITHNKRTMQIADQLYGVTMEEPGISKLVSVNLSAIGKSPDKKRATITAVA
jgi:chromosome segregation protein